jgi:hypothetical protein
LLILFNEKRVPTAAIFKKKLTSLGQFYQVGLELAFFESLILFQQVRPVACAAYFQNLKTTKKTFVSPEGQATLSSSILQLVFRIISPGCQIFCNACHDGDDPEAPNKQDGQRQWVQPPQYRKSVGRNELQNADTSRRNKKQADHLATLATLLCRPVARLTLLLCHLCIFMGIYGRLHLSHNLDINL